MAHILDAPCIVLPPDVDEELVDICNLLNRLPGITTYECCSGHQKARTDIFFHCYSLDTISRLGRVLERNYSDHKWELVVDSTDTNPFGCFWLRSRKVFHSKESLSKSLKRMADSILIWFGDCYNKHFANPATFVGVDMGVPGMDKTVRFPIQLLEPQKKAPNELKKDLDEAAIKMLRESEERLHYMTQERISRVIKDSARSLGVVPKKKGNG